MRIIIAPFIKIPCAECKKRPCFTRYNFAPKAGLGVERQAGGRLFCAECRLGSNAAHGPLVDERTCTRPTLDAGLTPGKSNNFQLEHENVL